MRYKEYGNTGMKLSMLGMGGNFNVGVNGEIINDVLEEKAQLVKRALKLGINFIDTCPVYACGYCEQIVGMGIKDFLGQVYVGAKTGLQLDKTEADVRRRIENSLKNLGREKIDIFYMWSIMNVDEYYLLMKDGGVYSGIIKAIDEGLVDHVGASIHTTQQDALEIVKDGALEGITISFHAMNYKQQLPVIQEASRRGMGVSTMNSLAGGMIPQNPELFESLEQSDRPVYEKGLRFVTSFDEISVALSSMETIEKIESNAAAFSDDNFGIHKINKNFSIPVDETLCTGCNYCSGCHQGIDVRNLMQGYNQHILFKGKDHRELVDQAFFSMRKQGQDPIEMWKCVGCGACEKKCTQKIDIVNRIQKLQGMAEEFDFTSEKMRNRLDAIFKKYKNKKIAIWPSCRYTSDMFEFYSRPDIEKKVEFFNSSQSFIGTEFRGKTVHGIEEVDELGIEVILITNLQFSDSIYEQLDKNLGNRIIVEKVQSRDKDIMWFF